jgi:hypothetical protein
MGILNSLPVTKLQREDRENLVVFAVSHTATITAAVSHT